MGGLGRVSGLGFGILGHGGSFEGTPRPHFRAPLYLGFGASKVSPYRVQGYSGVALAPRVQPKNHILSKILTYITTILKPSTELLGPLYCWGSGLGS